MRDIQKILFIIAIAGAIVASYVNLQLRGESTEHAQERERLSQEIDRRREHSKDDSISYALEGHIIPTDNLLGNPKSRRSIESLLSMPFSLVIVEARRPCTPCFDMALDRLSNYDWIYNNHPVSLAVISYRSHALKRRLAQLPMPITISIDDSSGEFHSKLNVPDDRTVAILSNGRGRILYARVVRSQFPHAFDLFLSRVKRIIS